MKHEWTSCLARATGRDSPEHDPYEAVALTKELVPDIVILAIGMSDLNGVEAARKIRKVSNNTEVLILSMHYSDELNRKLVGAGVRGCMLKSDPEDDLLIALETLVKHERFFAERAREVVLKDEPVTSMPLPTRLTSREQEILQLLAEGKTCKEAASYLGISSKTADSHRSNMMNKLDVHNISELVRYAVRNQIIEP
jgi:DNA-binding NarL/FixJ family response regulator